MIVSNVTPEDPQQPRNQSQTEEEIKKKKSIGIRLIGATTSTSTTKEKAFGDSLGQQPQQKPVHQKLLQLEKEAIEKEERNDQIFIEKINFLVSKKEDDDEGAETAAFTSPRTTKELYEEITSKFEQRFFNQILFFSVECIQRLSEKRRRNSQNKEEEEEIRVIEFIKENSNLTKQIQTIKDDINVFISSRHHQPHLFSFKDDSLERFYENQCSERNSCFNVVKREIKNFKTCIEEQGKDKTREYKKFMDALIDTTTTDDLLKKIISYTTCEKQKKMNDSEDDWQSSSFAGGGYKKDLSMSSSSIFSGVSGGGGGRTSSVSVGGGSVNLIKRVSKRGSGGGGGASATTASTRKPNTPTVSSFAESEIMSAVSTSAREASAAASSLQAKILECRAQFESRSKNLQPFEWKERVKFDKDISKPRSAMALKKSLLSDVFDETSTTAVRSTAGVFGVQAAIWTIRKDRESCHPFVRFAGEELKAFQVEKALADIEDTFHGGIPLDKYSAPQFDKANLESHTKFALMETLVSSGGLVNGSKSNEVTIAENISKLFVVPSFFDSDKDSHLMSMLFPLLSHSRFVPGTSHWDNVGRALISTYPQKNIYDVNVGIEIWAELSAQKNLIEKTRKWIASKMISTSDEIKIQNVSERKLISWIFRRTGNGYRNLSSLLKPSSSEAEEESDEGSSALSSNQSFQQAASKIETSRDEFDVLYQPGSSQISKPSEVFKAIAGDSFYRRTFGLFAYEMVSDVVQKYDEVGSLVHDFLRFREENFQAYRHEHGRDQARFLDERADLNDRSDMSAAAPPALLSSATAASSASASASASSAKMCSEPFCDDTVAVSGSSAGVVATKQSQGGRAAWHLSEAARMTGERNVYMSASPEDLEWDMAKETNCVLMFFHSVRKGIVEDIENKRKSQIERLSNDFEIIRKISSSSSSSEFEDDFFDEFMFAISKMKHQEDVNAAIDLVLTNIRENKFRNLCVERSEEFKKEIQRSITVRTIGGFAREDSSLLNPAYDTWHLKWATSSLVHALEKDNRDRMMGRFAARILWQTYVCVPKSDLGSACGASWYKFDEMGHNLRPITGTSEIVDDIVKFIGGIVTPSAETSAVLGDRTLRKHKTLEGNVRLNPIQLETIMEGGNRLMEMAKMLTEIKKMVNTDRGCKTIIDSMKTEKLIRCEQFNSLKNTDPNLVAFLNGVFDTGGDHEGAICSFRSGKIEDFITMSTKMAVPYGGIIEPVGMMGVQFSAAAAKTPSAAAAASRRVRQSCFYSDEHEDVKFMMNYLKKVFPDEEILSYAIRDMASMLFGANGEKIFRIWSGGGNNSKSILIKILQYGFGDYCFDLPAESICSKQIRNPSGPSPELAQGEGTRIGVMTEPADGVELDSGIIKRFTGGDRIHVRKLHENGGSIVASYKLILCCNDPPHLSQIDTATKNRVVILPFVSTWVDNPPPTDEAQMEARRFKIDPSFQAQAPRLARALMWKLIHSYADYKKVGIMERPKIMQDYVDNFWKTVDKYHSFKEQFVEEAPGVTLAAQDLYDVFAPWDVSQNPGSRAVGYGKFKQNMCRKDHLGPAVSLPGGKEGWNGYRIKIQTPSSSSLSAVSSVCSPSSPTPSSVGAASAVSKTARKMVSADA